MTKELVLRTSTLPRLGEFEPDTLRVTTDHRHEDDGSAYDVVVVNLVYREYA